MFIYMNRIYLNRPSSSDMNFTSFCHTSYTLYDIKLLSLTFLTELVLELPYMVYMLH